MHGDPRFGFGMPQPEPTTVTFTRIPPLFLFRILDHCYPKHFFHRKGAKSSKKKLRAEDGSRFFFETRHKEVSSYKISKKCPRFPKIHDTLINYLG
jgi:hypothetical protein